MVKKTTVGSLTDESQPEIMVSLNIGVGLIRRVKFTVQLLELIPKRWKGPGKHI